MKFLNIIIDTIKNMDIQIAKLMKIGLKFTFLFCLFSCYILITYILVGIPTLFYIGLSLFKTSLSFLVAFFIYAIAFNSIKQQIS